MIGGGGGKARLNDGGSSIVLFGCFQVKMYSSSIITYVMYNFQFRTTLDPFQTGFCATLLHTIIVVQILLIVSYITSNCTEVQYILHT